MSGSPAALIFRNRWKKESRLLAEHELRFVPKDPQDELWVVFDGPEGSPYEGGSFRLHIVLGQYPLSAPSVRMETRCYNPYISRDGRICCSLLVCVPFILTPFFISSLFIIFFFSSHTLMHDTFG